MNKKAKPKRLELARLRNLHYQCFAALVSALKQRKRLSAGKGHESAIEELNDRIELLQDAMKAAYKKIRRLKKAVGIRQ